MEQPLVSVIVPVYNAKLHIARCVESIRRQSYPNLEIILVNDGSSDVSLQVADVYARADKRILLIDKDNSGVDNFVKSYQSRTNTVLTFCVSK